MSEYSTKFFLNQPLNNEENLVLERNNFKKIKNNPRGGFPPIYPKKSNITNKMERPLNEEINLSELEKIYNKSKNKRKNEKSKYNGKKK
jgi:hypothetical protein